MKLYVIIFTHKHGTDAWPRYEDEMPGEGKIIEELRARGEWDEDDDFRASSIEIRGPFDSPSANASRWVCGTCGAEARVVLQPRWDCPD